MQPQQNNQFTIKLLFQANPANKKLHVKCKNKNYSIHVEPHPIFSVVEELTIAGTHINEQALKLLSSGAIQISINAFADVVRVCKENFNASVKVDIDSLMMKLFLDDEEQSAQNLMVLEKIQFIDVMKTFNLAYEVLNSRIHRKINRKLKRYTSISKRSENEKKLLDSLFKEIKNQPQPSPQKVESKPKEEKQQKQSTEKREKYKKKEDFDKKKKFNYNNKQSYEGNGGKRNNSSRQKIDPRIFLGLNGDTQQGWRQRHRPPRVPQQKVVEQKFRKQQKRKSPEKKEKSSSKASGPLGRVFMYPKDGKTFDFSTIVKKTFMLHINGSFWIRKDGQNLTITKDGKGFIRCTEIQTMSGNKGFMAQGLTVSLGGLSNLQDGGQAFGDPKVQEIISNENQWFNIVTMDVYT